MLSSNHDRWYKDKYPYNFGNLSLVKEHFFAPTFGADIQKQCSLEKEIEELLKLNWKG